MKNCAMRITHTIHCVEMRVFTDFLKNKETRQFDNQSLCTYDCSFFRLAGEKLTFQLWAGIIIITMKLDYYRLLNTKFLTPYTLKDNICIRCPGERPFILV